MSSGPAVVPPDQGGPQEEIKRQIIETGSAALEGLVEPAQRAQIVDAVLTSLQVGVAVQQAEITQTAHLGPIPAPLTLREYNEIDPNLAREIVEMAKRDQQAFISSRARDQWLDFSYKVITAVGGFVALGMIILGIIYLAEKNQNIAITALASIGVSGIVGAIVNARSGGSGIFGSRKQPQEQSDNTE